MTKVTMSLKTIKERFNGYGLSKGDINLIKKVVDQHIDLVDAKCVVVPNVEEAQALAHSITSGIINTLNVVAVINRREQ